MTYARLPLALLALAASCSDAVYQDAPRSAAAQADAQVPDALSSGMEGGERDDAGAPLDPGEPWHAALKKNYAVSVRFFAKDVGLANLAIYSHELFLLASVGIDGDKVTMKAQRCVDRGNVIAGGVKNEFAFAHPEAVPPAHYELVMRADGVRSESSGQAIGYRDEAAPGCTAGAQREVDGRPWLANGRCDCRSEPLPVISSDCRVIDEDHDMIAGLTMQHTGLINKAEPVRMFDRSQLARGRLSADGRIEGYYVQSYESLSLECGTSPCNRLDLSPCALELNPMSFEPLADGDWDCTKMLAEQSAGRLFALPPLAFASGC